MSETPGDIDPPIPPMDDAAARIRRWNRFYQVAAIWLAGWVGLIVVKMVKLDSMVDGLREGFMRGAFVAMLMLFVTLPLAWLGARIGSWERWRRWRLWFTFALPALYVLAGVVWALHGRYFPEGRFKRLTGVEFPREARVERCVVDGFRDWVGIYELTCPATETDRLIREMKLEKESGPPGWMIGPPSGGWIVDESWRGSDAPVWIFVHLQRDVSGTRARIMLERGM